MTTLVAPRAVVIEDQADLRVLETAVLEHAGWEVSVAADGATGLELVRRVRPDVVVCDLLMPGVDGRQVLRTIREDPASREIPVVVVSALDGQRAITEALEAGAHDFIVKPFSNAILRARCQSALRVRRAMLAVDNARRELELLAENATDMVLRCTTDGVIRYASPSAERLLGWPADSLVGRTTRELCHPDDLPVNEVVLATPTADVVTSTRRVLRADGGWTWIESNARVVVGLDGRPEIHSTARDITRQRDEREHLRRAEEELRLSFDEAPIGKALVGLDGRFLRVNERLCEIVDLDADELLGRDFQSIAHPDDLDVDLAHVADMVAGRTHRYTMDKRYLRADGSPVWVQLDVSLVRDDAGAPVHFIAQIQDISARRDAISALETSEALQRASLNALDHGVAMAHADRQVCLLNESGQRILGYTAEELTALFVSGRWETYREDGSLLPMSERPIAATLATGVAEADRVVGWRAKDGRFVVLRVATEPVYDDAGEVSGVVVAFVDVTAQRAMERAEREAVARLAWVAAHDSLTGLANRATVIEHLRRRIEGSPTGATALLYVDLDRFKDVNDRFGHGTGDAVLVEVAHRLEDAVGAAGLVGRVGGDEFLVVVDGDAGADAAAVAERVRAVLRAPVETARGAIEVSASVGLAAGDLDVDTAIELADGALLRAKRTGRDRVAVAD